MDTSGLTAEISFHASDRNGRRLLWDFQSRKGGRCIICDFEADQQTFWNVFDMYPDVLRLLETARKSTNDGFDLSDAPATLTSRL